MSKIRFWYAAGACSLAPHILLREAGVDFAGIETSVSAEGAKFPAGFESINPKMRIPVLAIDDEIITEVPAIATAIASTAPARYFMGRNTIETVRVYEWMVWLSGSVHGDAFSCLWRPQRYSDNPAVYDGITRKAMQKVRDCFAMIEQKIAGPLAIGDAFTAVDPYLYVFYRWGNMIGIDLDREYPRFAALGHTLATRPSVVAATASEKIDLHGRS